MFELLAVILFGWLFVKAFGLMLRLTWGTTQALAGILLVVVFPVLFGVLLFAGGVILLLPLVLIAGAVWILKACT